jgi:hypothetical protein
MRQHAPPCLRTDQTCSQTLRSVAVAMLRRIAAILAPRESVDARRGAWCEDHVPFPPPATYT